MDYAGLVARASSLALVMIGGLATEARSAPAPRDRVVLADPDPELCHAMEQALAPWHLEVVRDGAPPRDAAVARQRADGDSARFVVWRDADQLIVYDRELGSTERRGSRAGLLDPPTAAAAALTIKTMMRLPAPREAATAQLDAAPALPSPALADAAAPLDRALRLQAGLATRIFRSDVTGTSVRFAGSVALRPWASPWRFGLAGDAGSSTSVSRAGFKGTWCDESILGMVSWPVPAGAWEIEPYFAAGVRHATLDGTEMNTARRETATLATARGGVAVRWRRDRWSFGGVLAGERTFDAPTYLKAGTSAQIVQLPGIAAELGVVMAVDL
jgi:hypothetical protein